MVELSMQAHNSMWATVLTRVLHCIPLPRPRPLMRSEFALAATRTLRDSSSTATALRHLPGLDAALHCCKDTLQLRCSGSY